MCTMPLPPVLHIFDAGLRADASRSSNLDLLVRSQLDLAVRDLGIMNTPPLNSGSDDLVTEIGDYFTRTAVLWAQLTEHLVQGPHIDQASLRVHERSKVETFMSDLDGVAKIDVNITKLKRIGDLSRKFSREVQEVWRPVVPNLSMHSVRHTVVSPFCQVKLSTVSEATSLADDNGPGHFVTRKLLPENGQKTHVASIGGDISGSECSSDDHDDEQFQSIDMDALRQRGKGSYFCPKGFKCDKGGVDKGGNLVIFDRNSSFAQHCNKHRKPWRCDIPGCPNPPKKRRFARRDGLERHKTTVKHSIVT